VLEKGEGKKQCLRSLDHFAFSWDGAKQFKQKVSLAWRRVSIAGVHEHHSATIGQIARRHDGQETRRKLARLAVKTTVSAERLETRGGRHASRGGLAGIQLCTALSEEWTDVRNADVQQSTFEQSG
jgi:hypothetical protein